MRLSHLLFASVISLAAALPVAAETIAPVGNTPASLPKVEKAGNMVMPQNHTNKVEKSAKKGSPVNINTADAVTIADSLKGIGKKRAEAVVEYRTKNGPFKTVQDIKNVKGLSQRVIDMNSGKILLS